jgi:hexokinase
MGLAFNPDQIDDFARYYGFHYDCCDTDVLIQDFRIDMDRGLRGRKSSMPMIPTYLTPANRISSRKKVIALDAGGTKLRAARVRFDDGGRPVAEDVKTIPMPGTQGRLSAAQFFETLCDFCVPLFEDSAEIGGIGFCFSYPMEMSKDGDGIPVMFSKEVELTDLIGKPVGKGLREALARRKIKVPDRVVLLNDTVSTLLCGMSQIPCSFPSKLAALGENPAEKLKAEPGPVIGFILGTGFNTAYGETNIPKINFESKDDPQIVVCESGNFHFRYQGPLDKEFDASTKNPGTYTTEKASSGAYIGPFSLVVLKKAVSEGVLRFRKSDELLGMKTLETKDLNALLQAPLALNGPLGSLFGPDEHDALNTLLYLESVVTERGALLAASTLAAVVEHCGAGFSPLAPVRIAVEGSNYTLYHFMREALEARLRSILNKKSPRFHIIAPVEQASLFGAAAAAAAASPRRS